MFLNTVWQEMHAPLAGMEQIVNGLGETVLDEEQRRMLERLQRNSQLLQSIVDDVIDVSQIGINKVPLRKEAFNLDHEVREIIDILEQDDTGEDIIFNYHQRAGIPSTLIQPMRIRCPVFTT